ncbi:MAG: hypothetical protein AUJ49_02700 [Desulfovibrionaceae bacterium CG1_02_65_16]|nr:MAG: hypothetical protein AUJ49_02700 [Desulfovibrionaceae bacterium CG1_02_65_16]
MQDSQRATGLFLSLLLHALLITLAMLNLSFNTKVDMDKPMYTVDLVSLNPSADPAAGETGEPAGGPPTLAEGQPEEQQAAAAPSPPPPPPKAAPAKPEPIVRDNAKLISEKKVEEKKKPEKKVEDKTPPKPEQKQEKKPSREDLLKQALQDVKKDVADKSKQGKATAKATGKADPVAGELAALRKSTGGNIFTAGGTGRGGAGGGKGAGAGGTGTGLSSVYGAIVTQLVKSHWRYGTFARETNIVVTLEISIDPKGKITGARVTKSSGNAVYDDSAVRAAMETGVVPPPANKNLGTLHLNFNLQEMMK